MMSSYLGGNSPTFGYSPATELLDWAVQTAGPFNFDDGFNDETVRSVVLLSSQQ